MKISGHSVLILLSLCSAPIIATQVAAQKTMRLALLIPRSKWAKQYHIAVQRLQLRHQSHELGMPDLRRILREKGRPACPDVIRMITKAAGYRWRKARIVLTSNDPAFSEKLDRIRSIHSNLRPYEVFFSIDEFGPFAVKTKPGLALTAPGEHRVVPQWQKSRGCLILTAALELSGNQVHHFYCVKKNTDEMIRMMEMLINAYQNRQKIYLSWDAASWHTQV